MIGQSRERKWRYDFACRNCGNMQYVKDEIRDGMYCLPLMNGEDPIHADDDRIVRCSCYKPMQMEMELLEMEEDE